MDGFEENDYYRVYNEKEQIIEQEDDVCMNFAPVVDTGIDYYSQQEQIEKGNKSANLETYKKRFENALMKYKLNKQKTKDTKGDERE